MQSAKDSTPLEDNARASSEYLSSFLQGTKKEDVVFFRMDTPSQLEKEYDFGPVLGEGTFGVVYKGVRKSDNAKCAIKKILRERTYSASERARLDREISILRLVRHPGIIELLAVAESPSFLFLITELCEGDTLSDCLERLPVKSGLEEYVVVEIIRQVTSALSYLHNRGIIHRDLKSGNIMLLRKVQLDYRRPNVDNFAPKNHVSSLELAASQKSPTPGTSASTFPAVSTAQLTKHEARKLQSATHKPRRSNNSKTTPKHFSSATARSGHSNDTKNYTPLLANPGQSRTVTVSTAFPKEHSMVTHNQKLPPTALRIKIIDFGLAIEVRKNEEPLGNPCGTPLYMAPEVLAGRSYTRQCDVWSLGILMYQLLTCNFPFTAQNEDQLIEQLNAFDIKTVTRSLNHISPLAQNCLTHILHMDPAYRYSASELLLDPWVSQFSITNQEEVTFDLIEPKHSSSDAQADGSGHATPGAFHIDSVVSRTGNSLMSRPPSIGFAHSGSTHSTTNVLELMKQYHKQWTCQKQDDVEQSRSGAS